MIEALNGRFRDECLNENWFTDLDDARVKIEAWRIDYNEHRGQQAHGWLTPAEFAAKASAELQSPAAPSGPPMPIVKQAGEEPEIRH